MKINKQLSLNWQEIETFSALESIDQTLLLEARKALELAYAPYSNFHVGAAVLLDNGEIVKGANYENAAYTMCLCAERSAIAAVVSTFPGAQIEKMAITIRNPKKPALIPASPCGACRQVMAETEQRQGASFTVLLQGEAGKIILLEKAVDLLPFHFNGDLL